MPVLRTAPLRWPKHDGLLPRLLADGALKELHLPIANPTALDVREEGSLGRNYVRNCPKFGFRAFCPKSWRPTDGPGRLRVRGAVFFGPDTAGRLQGTVHNGALATALDVICSDLPMSDCGYERLFVTRWLALKLGRPVALGSVCGFEAWLEGGLSHCRLESSDGSTIHAECSCSMADVGETPPGLRQRWELLSSGHAGLPTLEVPGPLGGWWPPAAEALVLSALRAEPSLEAAVLEEKSELAEDVRPWDCTPAGATWDVAKEGTAALEGSGVKVMRRLFWRSAELGELGLLAVVVFTENAMGPPGRAHGGAIATAFEECLGLCCVRQLGQEPPWRAAELHVAYRRVGPLCRPLLLVARILEREGNSVSVEALLLEEYPSSGSVWQAAAGKGLVARASGRWVQSQQQSGDSRETARL